MKVSAFPQQARRWAGALLALLVCGLFAPTPALAGCVHDTLYRGTREAGLVHFEHLVHTGAMPANERSAPVDPGLPDPQRPCSGPTCSNNPGLPPGSPVTIAPGPQTWAHPSCRLGLSGPGSTPFLLDQAPAHPEHQGPSIFHPPRRTRS